MLSSPGLHRFGQPRIGALMDAHDAQQAARNGMIVVVEAESALPDSRVPDLLSKEQRDLR
jgi:hypothetical protein